MAFVSSIPVSRVSFAQVSLCSKASAFRGFSLGGAPSHKAMLVSMNLETIQNKIQEEMKKAQEATAKFGKASKEAATAWDIVEELEAEASHMKAKSGPVDPLEAYCDDTPEADECRIYED